MKIKLFLFLHIFSYMHISSAANATNHKIDTVDQKRYALFVEKVAMECKNSQLGAIAAQDQKAGNYKEKRKPSEVETKFFTGLHTLGLSFNDLALMPSQQAQELIKATMLASPSQKTAEYQHAYDMVMQYFENPEIQRFKESIQKFPEQAKILEQLNEEATRRTLLQERLKARRYQLRHK